MQVDLRHDGLDLFGKEALWVGSDDSPPPVIGDSTRIGLTKGAEARLRFFVAGSDYLSGTRKLNAHPA